jgi:hypothetical protein
VTRIGIRGGKLADDAGHETLEISIPAVFFSVNLPVPLYDPAEIAWERRAQSERGRVWPRGLNIFQ